MAAEDSKTNLIIIGENDTLYVRNIPRSMTPSDLEKYFSECGKIVNCILLTDRVSGLSEGVGFVLYEKHDEAQAAIATLNGKIPPMGTEPLNIQFNCSSFGGVQASSQSNCIGAQTHIATLSWSMPPMGAKPLNIDEKSTGEARQPPEIPLDNATLRGNIPPIGAEQHNLDKESTREARQPPAFSLGNATLRENIPSMAGDSIKINIAGMSGDPINIAATGGDPINIAAMGGDSIKVNIAGNSVNIDVNIESSDSSDSSDSWDSWDSSDDD